MNAGGGPAAPAGVEAGTALRQPLARLASLRNALLVLAFLLLIVAGFMPKIELNHQVHRVVITFDISQSMGVEDSQNNRADGDGDGDGGDGGDGGDDVSRLAAAREAARDLVRGLACGSEVGWSIFTGSRVMTLVLPLEVCGHYDALVAALDGIGPAMRYAESSGIGRGLYWALRSAAEIGAGTDVIFFSDGQEAPPLRPGESGYPGVAGDHDARGLLVGVGGDDAVPIPRTDRDGRTLGLWKRDEVVQRTGVANSHEELSRLDEAHLRDLARLSGLSYVRLNRDHALVDRLAEVGRARELKVATDLRWVPALAALALVCLHLTLPTRRVTTRRRLSP